MSRVIAIMYNLTPEQRAAVESAAAGRVTIEFLESDKPAKELLNNAEALIGRVLPEYLSEAPNLKWVQTTFAGVERIVPLLKNRDVLLSNASGAFGEGLSDHMLGQMLALITRVPEYLNNQRKHEWKFLGTVKSIRSLTVTVVGFGDIGSAFARKVKALGATVRGVKRFSSDKPDYVDELFLTEDLDAALDGADVVALSLPSTPETIGMISRERIFAMKPGTIILNIGRGSAIDQEALIDALKEKHILAGLDVTTPEPLPADNPLWDLEGVIITPHISGVASAALTRKYLAELIANNVASYLDGTQLENLVDIGLGY